MTLIPQPPPHALQVAYRLTECAPVDNITVRVDGYRIGQGGWLRLSLKDVAGDGGITSIELARTQVHASMGRQGPSRL